MFFEWLDRVLKTQRILPTMLGIGVFAYILWVLNAAPTVKTNVENRASDGPTIPLQSKEIDNQSHLKTNDLAADSTLAKKNEQQAFAREALEKSLKPLQSGNLSGKTNELTLELGLMKTAFEKWSSHLTELSLNDNGRMIVSNAAALPTVLTMYEGQEKLQGEFSSLTDEGNAILKASQEALSSSPDFVGSKETINTIAGTIGKVRSMRLAIEKLELALASFETSSTGLILADRTLAMALQDRMKTEAIAAAKALDRAREEQLAEFATKNKEAALEKARLEFQKEQAIALAEQKRLQNEAEDEKVKAERATLLADFNRDLPKIKHYLGKFFVVGHTQPTSSHSFSHVATEGPVSFTRLVAIGALNEAKGLETPYSVLLHLMSAQGNDRKVVAPFPEYHGGALNSEESAAIRPAFLLLKKYGQILVEKGYLQE